MKNLTKINAISAVVFLAITLIFCISDDIKNMVFFGILAIYNLIEAVHGDIIDKLK